MHPEELMFHGWFEDELRGASVQIWVLLLPSLVALGESPNPSKPRLPQMYDEDN